MSASELEEKVKAKRFRAAPTHHWSSEQTRSLLEEVRGEIKDRPESFEKPIAQKFYSKISAKCPLLANINWKVMKSKMRYLIKNGLNGAGLIKNGEEESVKDYIQNICPFFEILDEIFGLRKGVNPTVIIESSNIEVLYEDSEEVFLFDNVDDISNSCSSSRISASTPIPPNTPQPDVHLSLELSSNNASSFNGDSEIENLKKRMT
ncbi:uncharacterized protein LOC126766182 [Bactrocera neohumeralis]|uniref:uncharacterized protein LOC126766182 n=1 Tax=Bactrocera neohumeralis TaxID=98809 RepID=UPI002165BFCD|nr:uncharacterized protein LOC126766182 [Bactrocera neohumeralis]